MSAISEVSTNTSTDAYGNSVTSSVSNDELTSEDFINLMLKELEMQDPTKPVDSASMMDTQLQLSTLDANVSTVVAMEALQASFESSTLSNSASLIGNIVETGELNDEGDAKQYRVSSVSGEDGTVYLSAYEITEYYDVYTFDETSDSKEIINDDNEDSTISFTNSEGKEVVLSTYNKSYDDIAAELSLNGGMTASMAENTNGNFQLVVSISNGTSSMSQNNSSLAYSKSNASAYSSEEEKILFSSVNKIY